MSIANYIQSDVLLPRLRRAGILVVYDPARRYRDLCRGLAAEKLRVVDASEGSITSREQALRCLAELAPPGTQTEGLLVYVPAPPPVTDEDKQRDPFAIYGVCGSTFPEGDGDEYLSLCLKAKPDHATEIRRVFAENPEPSFAVIDAVGGGLGWPHLRALLEVESSQDILFALLAPSERQGAALKADDTWVSEARDLLKAALGLKLKTRAKSWSPIADELWRYLLFSEFVFEPFARRMLESDAALRQEFEQKLKEDPRFAADARARLAWLYERSPYFEPDKDVYPVLRCDSPPPGVR